MASGVQKWLTGCGIGCGLMILAVGGVGTCGYLGVRKMKDRVDRLDSGFEVLEQQYGEAGDFRPPADGAVPAGRLEAFLASRDAMAPARDKLAQNITTLDQDATGIAAVTRKFGAVASVLPAVFDFVEQRNASLAEAAMGPGEYLYLYSLVYYAWLGRDPGDGPSFAVAGGGEGRDGNNGIEVDWGAGSRGHGDEKANSDRGLRTYLHDLQVRMLGHQLEDARAAGLDADWIARLEAETERLAADDAVLMWDAGMPAAMAGSLEPYRDRLEASYSAVLNAVEVGMIQGD